MWSLERTAPSTRTRNTTVPAPSKNSSKIRIIRSRNGRTSYSRRGTNWIRVSVIREGKVTCPNTPLIYPRSVAGGLTYLALSAKRSQREIKQFSRVRKRDRIKWLFACKLQNN